MGFISAELDPALLSAIVVQLLSRVQLFATPWMAACQVTLSFTISQNLLKFMSIESVMLPHLVKITDTSDIAVVFYFGLLGNHDFYSLSHSALG